MCFPCCQTSHAAIEVIAIEAIKIVSIDINIIAINVRDKEIINIGTNATAVGQTNNLLEVLVLLTCSGIEKCFSRDLVLLGLNSLQAKSCYGGEKKWKNSPRTSTFSFLVSPCTYYLNHFFCTSPDSIYTIGIPHV